MTDFPVNLTAVPSRMGATARLDEERGLLVGLEEIQPAVLREGVVRLSVLTFLVDVSAGVTLDTDPASWTFTTDLSLRMRPLPARQTLSASTVILRQGRRSAHGLVEVVDEHSSLVAAGAIGFAHVPRKADDPPKPTVSPAGIAARFAGAERLGRPLREEAGIVAVDPGAGVVELPVRPEVCNPAGTLQGAMVALVVESAVEDMASSLAGSPVVVTEIDIRYLAQAKVGPVRSETRLLGSGPHDPVEVRLTDTGSGRITTLAHARAVPLPA